MRNGKYGNGEMERQRTSGESVERTVYMLWKVAKVMIGIESC